MAVEVERKGDAGVSQKGLDVLGMDAFGEEQRRAGVAQIVPADVGESGTSQQGLEGAVDDVLGVQGRALVGGEDKAVILPINPRLEPLLRLSLPVVLERIHGPPGEVHGAAAGVLGLGEVDRSSLREALVRTARALHAHGATELHRDLLKATVEVGIG